MRNDHARRLPILLATIQMIGKCPPLLEKERRKKRCLYIYVRVERVRGGEQRERKTRCACLSVYSSNKRDSS